MTRLRFDEVASALPELDELRPVLDHLLSASVPDPARRWSGSGELDTAGARLIESGNWSAAAQELAEREGTHLGRVYHAVLEAVACAQRGDDAAAAAALLEAAALEERRNRADRAEAYAASAAHVARSNGDPRLIARALRRQARAARATGRFGDAERLYASGHEIAHDAGDAEGAAEGAIGAGNVLEEQGRWLEAKGWYATALHLVESLDGTRPEQWHALLNLHVVTRSLGELDESVGWLRRAEDVAAALGDPSAAAIIHNAWGQLHMARGEFGPAMRRFRDALAEPAGAWARVNFRLNLGEALLAEGLTLEAAEETREAEREALGAGVASKLPEVYRLLGRVTAARGNADAFVLFERALEIVRERGLPRLEEAVTLQAYGDALREQDPERAGELRERAAALYRDLGIPGVRDTWAESYGLARDLPADETSASRGTSQDTRGEGP
jgi:tetratricopeptide (TPR) repeat protein